MPWRPPLGLSHQPQTRRHHHHDHAADGDRIGHSHRGGRSFPGSWVLRVIGGSAGWHDEQARAKGFPTPPDRLARLDAFATGPGCVSRRSA